jgi:surface antigen
MVFHGISFMDALIFISAPIDVVPPTQCLCQGHLFRRGETYMFMPQPHRILHAIQNNPKLSKVVGHVVVITTLAIVILTYAFQQYLSPASANAGCTGEFKPYTVVKGDTLWKIASKHNTTWQEIARDNKIYNPDFIMTGQHVCLKNTTSGSQSTTKAFSTQQALSSAAIRGTGNYFPSGQCTWWANERYHQLHGIYVPWTTNSNAWQWTARARDFRWQVTTKPTVGDIIDLQPWVQGASSLGHVAVVEKILPNGHVLSSNMNWGGTTKVVNVEFTPGPGVTFIHA